MKNHAYYVYILECVDHSYYTGITNHLEQRIKEHETGEHPTCYTYSRRPVVLKFTECYQFVQDAIAREKQIKRWSIAKKEALMNEDFEKLVHLAKNRIKEKESVR